MSNKVDGRNNDISRRGFLKTSAAVTVGMLAGGEKLFAAGSDRIRVGLIGCGGRGTGAVIDIAEADPAVQIVALADLFEDKVKKAYLALKTGQHFPEARLWPRKNIGDSFQVTTDTCFAGFDAYKKVIACDVDIVLLVTPPHFRPIHLKAAIEAGKHVFMEKPVAVDPVGVRSVIESSELAAKKGLAIVAGTQKRHQAQYLDIMKRIHDGAIGEIVAGQCYFNTGGLWVKKREPEWSDMELQCRNWLYYTWLSGDHIVEQHIHNIDVMNWALGSHPVTALGLGGRQARTAPEYGNIYDHFAIEFEYPGGVRVSSTCRQIAGCDSRISERVVGTKGSAYFDRANAVIEGANAYKFEGESPNPQVQEHKDLIASIRSGKPLNHGRRIADSTLTAVMGRMSAYTGRALKWQWAMEASELDLTPCAYEFSGLPVEPVAVPGRTKLI